MVDDLEFPGNELWRTEVPLPDDLDILGELGRAEATAIRHLERSNAELLAELQVAEDADFRAAVEENWVVLQRKYVRLTEISERVSLGLVLRARLCAAEPSSGSLGAGQGSAWDGSPVGTDSTIAAVAAVAPPSGAGGDDIATTLTRMQTLLRQVKRKASELEDDLMVGELGDLTLAPRWERKVPRLHESSTSPMSLRGADDSGGTGEGGGEAAAEGSSAGDGGTSRLEGPLPPHVLQDADTTERLGALLRGVRRKAAELEEDVVTGSLCGLSLSDALDGDGVPPDAEVRRREPALPARPRTRPKTAVPTK